MDQAVSHRPSTIYGLVRFQVTTKKTHDNGCTDQGSNEARSELKCIIFNQFSRCLIGISTKIIPLRIAYSDVRSLSLASLIHTS
jgi:hypothetical protein